MDVSGIYWVIDKLDWKNAKFSGKNIQISCPLAPWENGHKSIFDGTPSLGIKINENNASSVNCFGCHFGGSLEYLVKTYCKKAEVDTKTFQEVLRYVKKREEVDVDSIDIDIGNYEDKKEVYVEKVLGESVYDSMKGKTHQYILDRKVEIETLKHFDCGYDGKQRRVTFPIRNIKGELVGIVGRAVKDYIQPKAYNYFAFDKGRYFFGENLVTPNTILIITEGTTDCLLVWQELKKAGLLEKYSVVSSLGSETTKYQAKKIVQLSDEVICFYDNDPGGWSGQLRLLKLIRRGIVFRSVYYGRQYFEYDPAKLVEKGVDIVGMIESANLIV